jgi:tetratricopeptide (TPR) repeat protein
MQHEDLEQLRQAVQEAPQDVTARLALLQALIAAAAWQEAAAVGTALQQAENPPAATHALMGLIYGQQQRWAEAIAQYQQALAAQPDDAILLFNLGTLQAQHGDLAAAQSQLEKSIAQCETWAEAHYNLGTVLLRQERYSEAIAAFKRAAEHRDPYPEAHFNRGNAHAMKGLDLDGRLDYYELDGAIGAYKMALQQRPDYTAALYNLGMLYSRMNTSEGLRIWDQYLEATKEKPAEEVWRMRAREYRHDLQDRLS